MQCSQTQNHDPNPLLDSESCLKPSRFFRDALLADYALLCTQAVNERIDFSSATSATAQCAIVNERINLSSATSGRHAAPSWATSFGRALYPDFALMAGISAETALNGLSLLGTCVALCLFTSQLGLIRQMWKEGNAVAYSPQPTLQLLFVSLMWGGYAMFVLKRLDLQLLNLTGCLFSVAYLTVFFLLSFAPNARVRLVGTACCMLLFTLFLYGLCFVSDA